MFTPIKRVFAPFFRTLAGVFTSCSHNMVTTRLNLYTLPVTCVTDTSTPLPSPHLILSFIPTAVMDVLLTHSCSSSIQLRYSVCGAHRPSSPLLCPFLCVFLGLCPLSLFSGMSLFHLHSFRIIVSAPYGLFSAPPCPLVLRRCPSQLAAHCAISLCLPGSLFSIFCLCSVFTAFGSLFVVPSGLPQHRSVHWFCVAVSHNLPLISPFLCVFLRLSSCP